MKKVLYTLILFMSFSTMAQDGLQVGLNVSPSWKLNLHRNKLTTLRSSENGYGFSIGVPVKYWISDYTSFNTGLDYEFTAFDNFTSGVLASSFRFNSLHLPLMFNINMTGNWYGMLGTGAIYHLSSRDLNAVGGTDVSELTNNVQPYIGVGINTLAERGNHFFELGVLGRYQVLDVWNSQYEPAEILTSHILSLDFLMRFYL